MILDYDTRPDATFDEKIRSLRDSIQLALNELESYAEGQKTKGNADTALRIARQALAAATGGAEPATTLPLMDGTAAIGTDTKYARGDHRHPTDTSRASASDLSALTITVSGKVDKETGKGLSTEDYTSAEKTKLAGIEDGAEVNVQADWNETDSTDDAYIQNKPTLAAVATSGSYNDLADTPVIPPGAVVDTAMSNTSENAVQNKVIKSYVDSSIPTIPEWTLAGSVTGQTWLTGIPATAKEVYIEVYTGNHTAMYSGVYLRNNMTTGVLNIGGYYISASDYGLCNVNIANNGTEVQIRNHRYGGTNYTTTATMRVFYK